MAEGKKRLYHRATANTALFHSLEQALSINNGTAPRPYPFNVAEFAVFGSLVTTLGNVHDVDIFIGLEDVPEYASKRKDSTFIQALIDWEFKYFPEHACRSAYPYELPSEELYRFVKNGKGIISLHPYDELKLLRCQYVSLISNGKLTTVGESVLAAHSIDTAAIKALTGMYPLGTTVDMDGVLCMVFLEMYPYVQDGGLWLDAQIHAYDVEHDIADASPYHFLAHSSDSKLFGMRGTWADSDDLQENLADMVGDLLPNIDRTALQQIGISNDHPYALTDAYALMDRLEKAGVRRIYRDGRPVNVIDGTINDPTMTSLIDLYNRQSANDALEGE